MRSMGSARVEARQAGVADLGAPVGPGAPLDPGAPVDPNYYPPVRERKPFRLQMFRRKAKVRGRAVLTLCWAWLIFIVVVAIAAQWIPIRNPNTIVGPPNLSPNWGRELLGTDAVGHSMISRLAYGGRVSLLISICTTTISMLVGVVVGLVSVYFRGVMTVIVDFVANTILSLPGLLFLLSVVIVLKPSVPVLIGSIAVLLFPGFMRVARATAIGQMESGYVTSARGLGASADRIIFRELLPNTMVSMVTLYAIALPGAMLAEGSLSYLGLGVQPPTSSWGQMIAQGQQNLTSAPWPAIIPCIAFVLTVFSFYSIGDWVRARVDVRGLDAV